jgi:hypothetical protein
MWKEWEESSPEQKVMLEAGSMSVFADFINLQNCPEFGKV